MTSHPFADLPASPSLDEVVDATLRHVGPRIVLGTPLGLGKAMDLVNAFYRRAEADASISLVVYTALTLEAPSASSELERRLVEPMAERLFGGYPSPAWADALRRDEPPNVLPKNVEIREFYFRPGSMLRSPRAQRSYIASNYTHVVRDLLDAGLNVLAQVVAVESVDGHERYSLSCNPDLTLDLLPALLEKRRRGEKVAILGQVNRRLPFLYGDAMLDDAMLEGAMFEGAMLEGSAETDIFDAVIDRPELEFPLFGPPNEPIGTVDHLIALNVSTLVPDGGTLQIGIGALGDAIVHQLRTRHESPDAYRRILDAFGVRERHGALIDAWGGTGPFERGLYACSEMFVDGFLELYRAGILKRRVHPHATLQRLLDEGVIDQAPSLDALLALVDAGDIDERLRERDVDTLRAIGLFRDDVRLVSEREGERLEGGDLPADETIAADLSRPETRRAIEQHCLGDRYLGARLAHASFFLGPRGFYDAFRQMPRDERELFEMTRISFVNALYGQEELKRAQRRHARFVNTAMKITLLGAAASDGLEDGRVVSGVGGQYDLVAMAHALDESRSILMVRATRESGGELQSNLVWRYGHTTIPRHLKDLVVSEYGIADLRGKTDEEVVAALVEIADSRVQGELVEAAKRAGKLGPDYRVPDAARENVPERLEAAIAPWRDEGFFQELPFGTDLTDEEIVLAKALRGMKKKLEDRDLSLLPDLEDVRQLVDIPDAARPYLERLDLADPKGLEERLLQRAVVYALAIDDAI